VTIDLICIGQKMPTWINQGFQEYAQRLPAQCRLKLIEIPLKKRSKRADLTRLQQQEGTQMLKYVAEHVIALDERGQLWNSEQLALQLKHWLAHYSHVALLIGGPEGLASQCLQRAHQHWSLSALTLPHPLVRIIVAEQIYRAWSVLNHHPYHRA